MPKFNAAFWRWFGNSVVRNEDGSPKVVYRGDKPGKAQFTGREDKSCYIQGNIFFTDSLSIAKFYTQYRTNYLIKPERLGEHDGLYRVYLSLRHPLIVDAKGDDWSRIRYEGKEFQIDDLAVIARGRGYDGLIVSDVGDQAGWGTQYTAFHPWQIKSVDNDGTWDTDDPNVGSNPPARCTLPSQKLSASLSGLTKEPEMTIPIYRVIEEFGNPEIERYSAPRYRISLVKEAELDWPKRRLGSPAEAYELSKVIFEGYDREATFVFLLDQKHNLIGINMVSIGCLTESLVHPRELFKSIILANAAAFVFVHNHPSGDPQPSLSDRQLTDRIKAISTLVGVRMLDSVVSGENGYYSFIESGELQSMGQGVIRLGERDELRWGKNPGGLERNPGVQRRRQRRCSRCGEWVDELSILPTGIGEKFGIDEGSNTICGHFVGFCRKCIKRPRALEEWVAEKIEEWS